MFNIHDLYKFQTIEVLIQRNYNLAYNCNGFLHVSCIHLFLMIFSMDIAHNDDDNF